MNWIWNPKTKDSGIITCIPQTGECPNKCEDCFFQSSRSYLEPLEENLPHIPPYKLTKGRVVRMNDGNDSNILRKVVEIVAQRYDDYFFNTAIPIRLGEFSGPVVLTINPGKGTDKNYYRLGKIPSNLMFVRIRINMWNLKTVVNSAVEYYTSKDVPVVLTFMAYYTQKIPKKHEKCYMWKKRTLNSYWVLKSKYVESVINTFKDNLLVYTCGWKNSHSCKYCGNCIREYYNTKERIKQKEIK